MIKLKDLDKILKKCSRPSVVAQSKVYFDFAKSKGKGRLPYVTDFGAEDFKYMLPSDLAYYMEMGKFVLKPIFESKKKLDPSMLSNAYVLYTGILTDDLVVGIDTTKNPKEVGFYTRNEKIIKELINMGAFDFDGAKDDSAALEKKLGQLEGKLLKGLTSEKGLCLAYARIDVSKVLKDEVGLTLTLPNFRTDIGSEKGRQDGLKFYSYGAFQLVSSEIANHFKDKPFLTLYERKDKDTGVKSMKEVKSAFSPAVVREAYANCEEKNLVENKIRGSKPGWNVGTMTLKVYTLEDSLYNIGTKGLRLEDVYQIKGCKIEDIDTKRHTVNYDYLKALFITSVNKWKSEDLNKFKVVDLSTLATNKDKKDFLLKWVETLDNDILFSVIEGQPELFGEVKEGLKKKSNNAIKELKKLEYIDLQEDDERKAKQIGKMLESGVVKLTMTTTKSNSLRTVYCTLNKTILRRVIGRTYEEKYESKKEKLRYLEAKINEGKFVTADKLIEKIYEMDLSTDVNIDFDKDAYDRGHKAQAIIKLDEAMENLRKTEKTENPYLVMYKKLYPKTEKDLYGSVDVRNIVAVEYAALAIKK